MSARALVVIRPNQIRYTRTPGSVNRHRAAPACPLESRLGHEFGRVRVHAPNRVLQRTPAQAPPATRQSPPVIPNAEYAPTPSNCAAYSRGEVEDYLGTYYQNNAGSACLVTTNEGHNNCVRKCLQTKLADFLTEMKTKGRARASERQIAADEGIGRCRTLWDHHVQCYRDCGCQNAFVDFKHFFSMCDQPFGADFIRWSIGRYNPCMGPRTEPGSWRLWPPGIPLPPYTEP